MKLLLYPDPEMVCGKTSGTAINYSKYSLLGLGEENHFTSVRNADQVSKFKHST